MNIYMRNRFSQMSFEEYKKYCSFLKRRYKKKKKKKGNSFIYINEKKSLSSFGKTGYRKDVYNKYKSKNRRKYNDNTFNNMTYDISSKEYNSNFIHKNVSDDEIKIKIIKCDEDFIKNNHLLYEKDKGQGGGNGLFNNLFKNRKHIFFRRKNKNKIMDNNTNNNNKYNNNNNNMKNMNNWDEVIFSKFLKDKFNMIKKKNDIKKINEDTNGNEYFLENNINKERAKYNSINSSGILNYLFFKKKNDNNISYEALNDDTCNDNYHYNKTDKNVNNIYNVDNTTFNHSYNNKYNNSSVLYSKDYDEIYKNKKRSYDEKEILLNFRLDKNKGKNPKKSENTDNMVSIKDVNTKNYFINFCNNLQTDNFLMNEENEFDVYRKGDFNKDQMNVHNKSYNENINEKKKMRKKCKKGKTCVLATDVDMAEKRYNDGTIILNEKKNNNNNNDHYDNNNNDHYDNNNNDHYDNNNNDNYDNNNNDNYDNNNDNKNNFDMSYLKSNMLNNYIKGEKNNYYKKRNNTENMNECDNYDYNEINEDLNESQKMCYRSLRGSLNMEYIFKDSYELLDNNENNEYYYYNKFKSFYYEIDEENQTCSNIKEIISNKINAEFYHLKLNILILSCIIIQIFNSFILILISNNFILKRERIFFFCFLYSLLESVTDVISDNIFFLCGKFTNIYKKEFSINSIYIIQVISKMVLSVSTIFIYFIYHIFVILFNDVNIMIINTLIKALSIFVLSFIFLKNKDNIFSYYYNDKYVHLNNFFQKRNRKDENLDVVMYRELTDPLVKRSLYVSRDNNIINGFQQNEEIKSEIVKNGEPKIGGDVNMNVNYLNGDNKTFIPSNTSDLSFNDVYKYDAYIKDAYVKNEKLNYLHMKKGHINNTYIKDEDILNRTFAKGDYKKIRRNGYNIFFMDKLKCVLEVLNIFKFISRIKSYLCKRNRMTYDFNYTLLNVKSVKYDESKIYDNGKYGKEKKKKKKSKLYKKYGKNENLNFEIKIPTIKNIKDLFCMNNKFDWSSTIQINNLIKNCKKPLLNDNINMSNTWINNNNNNNNIKKKNIINKKKKIIINYPLKLLLNNLNFSNIFYICLLLIIPTFERIFLNYKIKNITLDLHSYCYLNIVNYITDLIGLYIYISYFNEESYSSSIFLSSLINIFLLSLRFLFLYKKFNQLGLLFLETILKSLHKTFFYMPIFILVTKVYIKNINNLMCSFYSSILDVSSFASYYFEYLILSFYNIDDSKNIFIVVYLTFLILHLLSLIVISKLKK
ncbi:conserved Plasmodium membrane protein, unknown function [Plasmodium sp. gorilla clade G3]|nr:conserved Plasmodium membrane protein, unknown function [Plasmodium sp. gorilla clade G3]